MSHKATHWAWTVKGISSAEKLTLLALADRHNADTNQCFPSLDKIADDTSLSRDTVRRATQSLEQKGFLSRRLVLDEHGRTLGYSYGLHMGDSTMLPSGLHHATHGGGTMLPKPVIETSKENLSCSKKVRATDRFNDFWTKYPRKVGKGAAEKSWIKALQSTEADTIIASLVAYKFSEDTNFIPHPATWLNQRRWEDAMEMKGETEIKGFFIESKSASNYAPWKSYFERAAMKFRLTALENAMDSKNRFPVPSEFPPP